MSNRKFSWGGSIADGNKLLRSGNYVEAIRAYTRALEYDSSVRKQVEFNLALARRRCGRAPGDQSHVIEGGAGTELADVDVILPVYKALEDVAEGLGAPQRIESGRHQGLVLVNDGSDAARTEWLHDIRLIKLHIENLSQRPKVTILVPIMHDDSRLISATIASVSKQIYQEWELILVGSKSTLRTAERAIQESFASDGRVKTVDVDRSYDILERLDAGLDSSSGKWVLTLSPGDQLSTHALYLLAEKANAVVASKLIYADEDYLGEKGRRYNPFFKPKWDYDRWLSQDYVSRANMVCVELLRESGGFVGERSRAGPRDVLLRCIEPLDESNICHVPFVLFHKVLGQENGFENDCKIEEAALSAHFQRTGQSAHAQADAGKSYLQVSRTLPKEPPTTSIIIPTKNKAYLLETCLRGILERTRAPYVEVVVVDNGSDEPDALRLLSQVNEKPNVRVIHDDGAFNFSKLINKGVNASTGEICVLLNNDVDVISTDWLDQLVVQAVRSDVGIVGAKLYYENETIQHAGVLLGVKHPDGSVAAHGHRGAPRESNGYFDDLRVVRACSAVTGACMAFSRALYEEIGGFDEENLAVSFNDVDFCLKAQEAGYKVIWTPDSELFHYENVSRGNPSSAPEKHERNKRERQWMRERWGTVLDSDPYYNPNLSLYSLDYSLAKFTRADKPWEHFPVTAKARLCQSDAVAFQKIDKVRAERSIRESLDQVALSKRKYNSYLPLRKKYRRKLGGAEPNMAIFTAITNGYNSLKCPIEPDPRFDYIVFSDAPLTTGHVWDVRRIPLAFKDRTREARFVKTHPHWLLPDYDVAIWIDSNIVIMEPLREIVDRFLNSGKAVAGFPHPMRESIYEEWRACAGLNKDDETRMAAQVEKYRVAGFDHDDLIETNIMMFDLRQERTGDFLDSWWGEITEFSKRDQLSVNYALRQAGVEYFKLDDRPNSIRNNKALAYIPHDRGKGLAGDLLKAVGAETVDPNKKYANLSNRERIEVGDEPTFLEKVFQRCEVPSEVKKAVTRLRDLGLHSRAEKELKHLTDHDVAAVADFALIYLAFWNADKGTEQGRDEALVALERLANKGSTNAPAARALLEQETLYLLGRDLQQAVSRIDAEIKAAIDFMLLDVSASKNLTKKLWKFNNVLAKMNLGPVAFDSNYGKSLYERLSRPRGARSECGIPCERQPQVTVVMPVYNSRSTVDVAINSMLEQTWSNLELIIVDDASNDGTPEHVKQHWLEDHRVRMIECRENGGPYMARNIGLDAAKGDYVTCVDADDWSHYEKIEVQARHLFENQEIVANMSKWARADEELNFSRRGNPGFYVQGNISSLMFRRKPVLNDLGGWDVVRFGADTEFFKRINKKYGKSKVTALDRMVSIGRVSRNSLTGSSYFGYPGYPMGARKEHKESYDYYHSQNGALKYPLFPKKRQFPAPNPLIDEDSHKRKKRIKADTVILADFRNADSSRFAMDYVDARAATDVVIALAHVPSYDLDPEKPIYAEMREWLNERGECFLVYGERVQTNRVLVYGLSAWEVCTRYIPDIETEAVTVIVDREKQEPPFQVSELENAKTNIVRVFDKDPVFCGRTKAPHARLQRNLGGKERELKVGSSPWQENVIEVNASELDEWVYNGSSKVAIVMPCIDVELGQSTAETLVNRAGIDCTVVIVVDDVRGGFIRTLNAAAKRIASKFLVYLAQDAFPGREWLKEGVERLEHEEKSLLGFNDGKWQGRIASFGLVRRSWARRIYGDGILCPEYSAHKADNEITVLARVCDEYVYSPEATLVEVDREKDRGGSNKEDDERFEGRFKTAFNGLVDKRKLYRFAAEYNVRVEAE